MGSVDRRWKEILKNIQNFDNNIKLVNDVERNFLFDPGLCGDEKSITDMKQTLFITLTQYTSNDMKAKVYAEGEDNVIQTYKWMCWKGQDFDEKELVELRSKVLNPERASEVKDVEKEMAKWKADALRLAKVKPEALKTEDWVHPLWMMMPEILQDRLIYRGITTEDGKK